MIVSCESCKSRYKLDDNKITGRGAKITCPKCKHVFVVLAPAPAPMEVSRPTARAVAAASGSDWEDDEPTRIGKEFNNASLTARAASEPPPSDLNSGGSIPPPRAAPAVAASTYEVRIPRGGASVGAPVTSGAPTTAAVPPADDVPATPEAGPAPAATRESIAARAATLDFRKVGVTAWKVKVRIGLVYDFSDIKTLRKYIQDGRVTSADVIGHDGKTWKPIGEIPDLDAFFVESFDRLATEWAAKGGGARKEAPSDVGLGNVAEALAAAAAAEADLGEPGKDKATGPVYVDPFEALKQKQRGKMQKARGQKTETSTRNSGILVAAALLFAVGAGGWWWMRQGDGGESSSSLASDGGGANPKSKVAKPKEPTETADDVRRKIEDKLREEEERRKKAEALNPPSAVDPPPIEVAVTAADCPSGRFDAKGGCLSAVGPRPGTPGTSAPLATSRTAPTVAAPTLAPSVQTQQDSVDEEVGDDAARRGDWNMAVTAYANALAASGKSADLLYKYGNAQTKAGDDAGGRASLEAAADMGSKKAKEALEKLDG